MAKATFIPAPQPEGTIAIELTETEARQYIGTGVSDPFPMTWAAHKYVSVRDAMRAEIRDVLARG